MNPKEGALKEAISAVDRFRQMASQDQYSKLQNDREKGNDNMTLLLLYDRIFR